MTPPPNKAQLTTTPPRSVAGGRKPDSRTSGKVDAPRLTRLRPLVFGLALGGIFCAALAGMAILNSRSLHEAPPPKTDAPPKLNPAEPPGEAPEGMVWVPGGWFWMGSEFVAFSDARPVHQVYVDGFWMDKTEVTNAQFAQFVAATKYLTVAERDPDPKDFPGAPKENLVAGSIVFTPPEEKVDLNNHLQWWRYTKGACWKHPEGPGSTIKGRENHPAVHICWDDAVAYAKWAGKRLPTEAEWEFAARGGRDRAPYVWGKELQPDGKWMANIWQGEFPHKNTADDGHRLAAPVAYYPANGYGLHDMSGNVWEWCADWYRPDVYTTELRRNPQGPKDSHDPLEVGVPKRVQRGGSFLCSDQYCIRYMNGGRGKGEVTSASSHVGFRCVRSAK